MQLISKYNEGFWYLSCVLKIISKYAWVVPLRDKKGIIITNLLQKSLNKSNCKPNKIWVNKSMKSWWLSLHWKILIMLLSHWLSFKLKRECPIHCVVYDYSRADWDDLCDHLRDVPEEDIFKFGASAAASEFCDTVQVQIDVYISHRKYQVKPHSCPWFSATCAATIVHINLFFLVCSNRINLNQK